MKKIKFNLGIMILIAMFIGILAGILMKEQAAIFTPLGDIFIKLIKMLVIPLVFISIISGAAALGKTKAAGKVGVSTFVYYLITTSIAVILGLIFGGIFKPGIGLDPSQFPKEFLDTAGQLADKGSVPGFWATLIGIIPVNPFEALITGNILQILFFSLFLGIGLSVMPEDTRKPILNLIEALNKVLIWMIEKVMFLAPLGVFGLMASAVGTFGYELLGLVMKLLIVYVAVLAIQTFGLYPLFVKLLSKVSPFKFLSKIYEAQIVALSTSSSMATLPVTYDVCEKELNVSKETASFVLPLGATINMDGNAIYYALVAMFFSQLYGIELGLFQYSAIILTATIGSIGQAGVPGPSLLVVAVLLAAGLPVKALPLLFGVDRIFDMLRTAVNITGDASCAVIIDHFKNTIFQSKTKGA